MKTFFARFAGMFLLLAGCGADPIVEYVPDIKSVDTADAGSSADVAPDTAEVEAPKPCDSKVCDDNDPCTDDSCDKATGKCIFNPATGLVCDDDKACTNGDACKDGKCLGSLIKCDDNDPCTTDACDPKSGKCANTLVEGCAPEDPCAGVICNDSNECTDDSCDKVKGCQHIVDDGNLCITGSLCTTKDHCVLGQCIGDAVDCNDGNQCTADYCDQYMGCQYVYAPNFWACDDGYPCTVNDACKDGKCVTYQKSCDDGNSCTNDSCEKATGKCFNTVTDPDCGKPVNLCKGVQCNDGNKCTTDECNPATGKCESYGWAPFCCNNDADCADACLVGKCTSSGCEFASKDCDDKNPCTKDTCKLGIGCQHTTASSGTVCATETSTTKYECNASAQCVSVAKTPPPECTKDSDCADISTCTADACVSNKCIHTVIPNCGAASNQPSYKLMVTWKANAAAKAAWTSAGADKLTLGGFCKGVSNAGVSGPDVVVWNEQHMSGLPTADELKFEQDVIALASCQWQIYAWKNNSQVAWGASAGPVVLGSLSYSWNGYSAVNVGVVSNGKGGYNWGFTPGQDSDGDSKLDATEVGDAKYDGSK